MKDILPLAASETQKLFETMKIFCFHCVEITEWPDWSVLLSLGDNFSCKISQKIWCLLGLFWTVWLTKKKCFVSRILTTIETKLGYFFIPTSGHTERLKNDKFSWNADFSKTLSSTSASSRLSSFLCALTTKTRGRGSGRTIKAKPWSSSSVVGEATT